MDKTEDIGAEISIIMPVIARRVLLDFFQSVDISQSQLLMVMVIFSKGTCRLSELSAQMEITNPTASGLVDRLVQNGYVKRAADPDDRRAVCISLSNEGKKLAGQFRKNAQKKWVDILNQLPTDDQQDFIRILRNIRKLIP